MDDENPLIRKAYKVFSAGVGLLKSEYESKTSRPIFFKLPNPHNKPDDYVDKASTVYLYGMSYIMYHEYSHLILEHKDETTKDEEESADESAFWIIEFGTTENEKKAASIGMITALCSLVFLDNTMKGDFAHVDSDIRLTALLTNLKSDDEHYWALAVVMIKLWAYHYKLQQLFDNIDPEIESWQQLYNLYMEILSRYKKEV